VGFPRTAFDHIGIPTTAEHEGALFLEADGVWVTNPREHPLNIEWVRYRPDSRMPAELQQGVHVAYRVPDLDAVIARTEVIVEPFVVGDGFARIAFARVDGAVTELMEYADPHTEGWILDAGRP
jgi:hypothetical protein